MVVGAHATGMNLAFVFAYLQLYWYAECCSHAFAFLLLLFPVLFCCAHRNVVL